VTDAADAPAADWSDPGPVAVAPGIHRIALPMPQDGLRAVNVYAIEDGQHVTMIDGGWAVPTARAELEKALDQLGYGLSGISRFLVTHAHRDHYTLAVLLRREYGTAIGLGAGEQAAIAALTSAASTNRFGAHASLLRQAGAAGLADLIADGDSRIDPLPEGWEEPDEWLEAGLLRVAGRTLRILPTPGHTRGHIVFADQEAGLLFAGDHVLPHITPSIGFEPAPSSGPLSDYLDSLALIRALPDLTLLPAHGFVAASTHARIDELVAHHDARLRETGEAVAGLGSADAAQVAGVLGWTRRRRSFASLDPFNQMLAVTETVAHLKLLVVVGLLTAAGDDVVSYRAAVPAPPA
jgi:glyoxylase-like metal-dependent hydrolase (beta-lactamase superfamily II)